jgi:prepilin-type N-terminal cleavage/methylation domain-containing protein
MSYFNQRKISVISVKAFTLLEVMLTVAVLSIGTIFVYQAFFNSLDAFNYCLNYLNVTSWMDEKIWQAQDSLAHFANLGRMLTDGKFVIGNKHFKWDLSYSQIDEVKKICKLYKVDLAVSWQEGKRQIKLVKNAYARYEKKP